MRNITVGSKREKSEFILYNTLNFLLDEALPSLEIISQHVILQESNIAVRLTEYAADLDQHELRRPHSLDSSSLISNAIVAPTWTEWKALAG